MALVQEVRAYSDLGSINTLQSTSTTYVAPIAGSNGQAFVKVDGLDTVTVIVNVTTNIAAKTIFYKGQYSHDGTNWVDYTVDVPGTASGGEQVITQNSDVRSVDAATTGYKPLSGTTYSVRAPYFRVIQRSGDASTLAATYYIKGRN